MKSPRASLRQKSPFSLVILLIVVALTLASQIGTCTPIGQFVKVCSSRELKQVTESICSTIVRRDSLPILAQLTARIKRITPSEMAVSCCSKSCSISYFALLCD